MLGHPTRSGFTMIDWDNLDEDTAMTYQEWRDAGFSVSRGEKARLRDALGQAQFTIDQVVPLTALAEEQLEEYLETGEITPKQNTDIE